MPELKLPTAVILVVLIICISGSFGCSQAPESANKPALNAAVNANSNTSAANSNAAANTEANKTTMNKKTEIDRDFLTGSLKTRLQGDDKKKHVSDGLWSSTGWLGVRIGVIYKDDDEFILKAVREVTNGALALNNLKLTKNSWQRLAAGVNHDSLCSTVVDRMLEASLDNEILSPPNADL